MKQRTPASKFDREELDTTQGISQDQSVCEYCRCSHLGGAQEGKEGLVVKKTDIVNMAKPPPLQNKKPEM